MRRSFSRWYGVNLHAVSQVSTSFDTVKEVFSIYNEDDDKIGNNGYLSSCYVIFYFIYIFFFLVGRL